MKISDEEFDHVFQSRLSDLSAEPSAQVWDAISAELKHTAIKPKRVWSYMQIAASIMVLTVLGAMWLWLPKQAKIVLHGNYNPSVKTIVATSPTAIVNADSANAADLNAYAAAKPLTAHLQGATAKLLDSKAQPQNNQVTDSVHIEQASPPVLKAATPAIANNTQPDFNNAAVAIKPSPLNKDRIAVNSTTHNPAINSKKKRIRGIADLLNIVIATVDKRPNKIIEFSDDGDNDDGFDPTRINLGQIHTGKHN